MTFHARPDPLPTHAALPGKHAELANRSSREIAVSLLDHHRAGGIDLADYQLGEKYQKVSI